MKKLTLNKGQDYLIYREGSNNTTEIYDIAVTSERQKGYGTQLIKKLEKKVKGNIFAFMRYSNDKAKIFYEKNGFNGTKIDGFYPDEDAILYVKNSGTKACAEYLGGVHEPRGRDWDWEVKMWEGRADKYITHYLIPDFKARPRPYIEVNSAIAPVCKRLKELMPELKIYHIKRKKEDVVKSILKRENYTDHSEPRNSPKTPPEYKTREEKIGWFVEQYYKFMEGFPEIETESIPIIRNQS